jgi:predicted acetyltransferase
MSLKLRTAEIDDLPALGKLHQLSYPLINLTFEQRQASFADNARCALEDVWVVSDEDEIAACMVAYPFTSYQDEVEIPVLGIGTVAVRPDRRRQGVAGFLIKEALNTFESQGFAASILYPFQHRFYRRLGWGYAGEVRRYHLASSQLEDYDEILDDPDLAVDLMREEDFPDLMAYYENMARRSNGMLRRNPRYWRERILAPGRNAVLARFSGDLIAYAIYSHYPLEATNLLAQGIEVHEWLAPTLDGRDALLSYFARQADQVETMQFLLPADEPFHLWVDDPRDVGHQNMGRLFPEIATMGLGWMYRVLNLKSAFEGGRKFNGVQGDLTVEVLDEQLGDRRVTVNFTGKGAHLQEREAKTGRLLQGSVDAFSQLFCGYVSAATALEQGLLTFEGRDTVEFCQNAFDLPAPRCFDLF